MSDLTLKYDFTDRGGSKVYDVIGYDIQGIPEVKMGQVRIPPDPRIAELEARRNRWKQIAEKQNQLLKFKIKQVAEMEASQKPPEKDTWEEAYGIQADQIIKLNRENSKLKAQLEGMRLAYEICKDPALEQHRRREND
jgi:hypothetical protein